jgi:streptogramin lyase
MSVPRWLKAVLSACLRRPAPRVPTTRSLPPRLEALEDRCVPAVGATEVPLPTGSSNPRYITAGPDGNLWFTEQGTARIGRITPGGALTEFSQGITANSSPTGITAGPDGNLWFTEFTFTNGAARVGRITPSGTVTEFSQGITGFANPEGITAGPDGNLWFIENNTARVGRITPSGTITEFSQGITGNPDLITAGPDGNLWFTEGTGQIGRITTGGTITEFTTGITTGSTPNGITAGPDGNLWFTENSANKIGRITPTGTVTEFRQGIAASSGLQEITAGPDGNLWFAEQNTGKIGRITPFGVVTEFSQGITPSGGPFGITAAPDGNLWFTEYNFAGNKISRLKLLSGAGAPVSVAAGQTYSGVLATVAALDPATRSSDLQAVINWGDGSSSPGSLSGTGSSGFSVGGTHTYTMFGPFTASITVSNVNNPFGFNLAPTTDTAAVTVNVHNLLDPSFQMPPVGFGNFAYAPAGSPWVFGGTAGLAANLSGFTAGNPPVPQGGQVAFLQDRGTVAQSFALPDGTYTVSLLAAQRGAFNAGPQTLQVFLDGALISTLTPAGSSFSWLSTNSFTVEGGFHYLGIAGLDPSGGDSTALVNLVRLNLLAGIADPSFEFPALAPGSFAYAPAGSPWRFSGSAGLAANGSGFTSSNPPAPAGNQVLFLQMNGSARQVLDFAAGTYTVSVEAAERGNFNAHNQTFSLFLDSNLVGTFNNFSGTAYNVQVSGFFTVQTGPHTLIVQGTDLNGGDCTILIDQVALQALTPALSDPDFATPAQAAGGFNYDPSGSPWAFTGSAGLAANGSGFTSSNPPAPAGNQVAFLQGSGAVSQSIMLAAGTYDVSLLAAQRGNFQSAPQTVAVYLDGALIGLLTPSGTAYSLLSSNSVTVAGGSHFLGLVGVNPSGGSTVLIDDVFLTQLG